MAKIFVTGATGFIGKRLVYSLLEQGHEVYGLIRQKGKERSWNTQKLFHPIYGDLAFPEKISLPKEIEVCYYLVHSMGQTSKHLEGTEEKIAHNFTHLIEKTKCRQLIFLGGIIEEEDSLSPHLFSRLKVEKVLQKSKVPTTILRASIIIGSGSASFEIIRECPLNCVSDFYYSLPSYKIAN